MASAWGQAWGASFGAAFGALSSTPTPAQATTPLGGSIIRRAGVRRRVLPYIEPATAPAPDYALPDIEHIGATPPQLPLKRSKKRRDVEHVLFLH